MISLQTYWFSYSKLLFLFSNTILNGELVELNFNYRYSYNFRVLYSPIEWLSVNQRAQIGFEINPVLHSELHANISDSFKEWQTYALQNIWQKNDISQSWCSKFGSQKFESINDFNSFKLNVCSNSFVSSKSEWSQDTSQWYYNLEIINHYKSLLGDDIARNINEVWIELNHDTKEEILRNEDFKTTLTRPIRNEESSYRSGFKNKAKRDKDYERQNVFFKTILRDFRKFISSDFDMFVLKNVSEIYPELWYSQKANKSRIYSQIMKNDRLKIIIKMLTEYACKIRKKIGDQW